MRIESCRKNSGRAFRIRYRDFRCCPKTKPEGWNRCFRPDCIRLYMLHQPGRLTPGSLELPHVKMLCTTGHSFFLTEPYAEFIWKTAAMCWKAKAAIFSFGQSSTAQGSLPLPYRKCCFRHLSVSLQPRVTILCWTKLQNRSLPVSSSTNPIKKARGYPLFRPWKEVF